MATVLDRINRLRLAVILFCMAALTMNIIVILDNHSLMHWWPVMATAIFVITFVLSLITWEMTVQ